MRFGAVSASALAFLTGRAEVLAGPVAAKIGRRGRVREKGRTKGAGLGFYVNELSFVLFVDLAFAATTVHAFNKPIYLTT